MSHDAQVLIALREYVGDLEAREVILAITEFDYTTGEYQRSLEALDRISDSMRRRHQLFRAWARGESPVLMALTLNEASDNREARWRQHHDNALMVSQMNGASAYGIASSNLVAGTANMQAYGNLMGAQLGQLTNLSAPQHNLAAPQYNQALTIQSHLQQAYSQATGKKGSVK